MKGRAAIFDRLRSYARDIKNELKFYQLVRKDPRTPRMAKILLGIAIGYALLPFDLIPDFIPVVGYLDDVLVVALLVRMALKMIPREVVDECRRKVFSSEMTAG